MRKVFIAVVAFGAAMSTVMLTPSATATSNVVAHEQDWGRIVDGPNGRNSLVYACDGEADNHVVWTEYTLKSHTWPDDRYEIHYISDANGANNGCVGVDLVLHFGYVGRYAQSLRVCEEAHPIPCTQWYNTNW